MARTKLSDLDRAWDAVRHAARPRIHTLIATSEIHMKHKLKMTRDQVGGRMDGCVVCLMGGLRNSASHRGGSCGSK